MGGGLREITEGLNSWEQKERRAEMKQGHSWSSGSMGQRLVWHRSRRRPRPVLQSVTSPYSGVMFMLFLCSKCSSDFPAYKALNNLAPGPSPA